ncbi:MAG: RNA polymerase sigma factor [Planctomycetes bacterium]|nr:RNA polymerase sigma factor [Planctomycetota bacterium]
MEGDAAETVARARAGDATARAAIAQEYGPRIGRFVATMVGDRHAADDLTQECMRLAFERLAQLQDPERLSSWVYAIAVNACRAHLRRLARTPQAATPGVEDVVAPAARRSVPSAVVARESAEALALALDRLPILLREAFVLHVVEGLPYAEIAVIAGATPEALHVRAHRGKALLRRQLGAVVDTFWSELGDRPEGG